MNLKLLKKSPLFTAIVVLLLVAFLAQLYLVVTKYLDFSKAKKAYMTGEAKLQEYADFKYALTPEVEKEVINNYNQLDAYWQKLVESMSPSEYALAFQDTEGARLTVRYGASGDYMKTISRQLDRYKVEQHPIAVENSAQHFGFSNVVAEMDAIKKITDQTQRENAFKRFSQQGKVLSYLMKTLLDSRPQRVTAVKREAIVPVNASTENPDYFVMPKDVSLRTETMSTSAFQVGFVGYSDSLQSFMKEIESSFSKVPVIVRDVQVKPYTGTDGAVTPEERGNGEPVVSNNLSEVTVTIEYLEVVPLPVVKEEVVEEEHTENNGNAPENSTDNGDTESSEEDENSY